MTDDDYINANVNNGARVRDIEFMSMSPEGQFFIRDDDASWYVIGNVPCPEDNEYYLQDLVL